jgi:putative membrane protein
MSRPYLRLDALISGATTLSNAMNPLDQSVQSLPSRTQSLATGSAQGSAAVGSASAAVASAPREATAVVATLCERPGPLCNRATAALAQLQQTDSAVGALAGTGLRRHGHRLLLGEVD